MGSELAQEEEWSPDHNLNWLSLDYEQVEYGASSSAGNSVNSNLSGRFSWQDLLGQDYSQPSILERKHLAHHQRRLGLWLLLRKLNAAYRQYLALHRLDTQYEGFRWLLDCDHERSIFSFIRRSDDENQVIVILNFTPVPRLGERVGVPNSSAQNWTVLLNSDEGCYAGSGVGPKANDSILIEPIPWQNREQSVAFDLPPLGAVLLTNTQLSAGVDHGET